MVRIIVSGIGIFFSGDWTDRQTPGQERCSCPAGKKRKSYLMRSKDRDTDIG